MVNMIAIGLIGAFFAVIAVGLKGRGQPIIRFLFIAAAILALFLVCLMAWEEFQTFLRELRLA